MGTIRFGNDHPASIIGYGDYVQGNITVCHVYYVEGLGHNLFSVGQFYDGDLEVAFRSKTCYVRNLEGDDLLTGARESNLKPNVEYFHVFGSLCYPTNDRDDLGKMKPKADIGIFIGYSEKSRGLEPAFQCFINDDSSAESMNTPSKEDLDNLFGPMYDEYFEKKSCMICPFN
ncbi:hypothetical protein Tco_0662172 [Tanacetum coccineum]